jgi:hypothetical protein
MPITPQAAAQVGAALLDERVPNWPDRVTDRLQFQTYDCCIWGQVRGVSSSEKKTAWVMSMILELGAPPDDSYDDVDNDWLYAHGFMAHGSSASDYDAIREAWEAEIAKRRTPA